MRRARGRRARAGGAGLVEWLVAVPVLLMLGLFVAQVAELMVARRVVAHALDEAARAGATGHAGREAIARGFAHGMAPWWYGARSAAELALARERALDRVRREQAAGWIAWSQRSPMRASFVDWGEPAVDDQDRRLGGVVQIARDHLLHAARLRRPASGVARWDGDLAVGRASGQSLVDANVLRLELTYGVPLHVPFANRLLALALRKANGCAAVPDRAMLGALTLRTEPPRLPDADAARCRFYEAADLPRVPVSLSVTALMQSPARLQGSWLQASP